jgi:diguanylate cyclase (GGDEF)-like protein
MLAHGFAGPGGAPISKVKWTERPPRMNFSVGVGRAPIGGIVERPRTANVEAIATLSRSIRLMIALTVAAGFLLPAVVLLLPHRPDWPPLDLGTAGVALAASALTAGIVLLLSLRQDRSMSRSHLRHHDELVETSQSVIGALVFAADPVNEIAARRIRRIQSLATEVAMAIGLPPAEVAVLRAAVLLRGLDAEQIERSRLPAPLARVIRSRFEKFDGTGGPDGLRGEQIPAAARVLGAVERFETLLAGCGGTDSTPPAQALADLRDEAGTTCDPEAVRLLITAAQRLEGAVDSGGAAAPGGAATDRADDPLTHLPAASHLFSSFEQELRRAAQQKAALSLIELDVDGFGAINERYGRAAGDRVLRGLARAIRGQMRPGDTCVRYAGDQFLLILTGVAADQIEAVAARLEQGVLRHKFAVARNTAISVDVTLGCASFPADGRTCEDLIAIADARMRQRKLTRRGRASESDRKFHHPGLSDISVN